MVTAAVEVEEEDTEEATTKGEGLEDTVVATVEEEDTAVEDTAATKEEEEDIPVCELTYNIFRRLTGTQEEDIKILLFLPIPFFQCLVVFVLVLCNAFPSITCLNRRMYK